MKQIKQLVFDSPESVQVRTVFLYSGFKSVWKGGTHVIGQMSSGLRTLDASGAKLLAGVVRRSVRWYGVIWLGASKGLVKKRTGSYWQDWLSALFYDVCQALDRLDTLVFFRQKPFQAKACRVRSRAEKIIANWLTDHDIAFIYERQLRLGWITLKPDFYLREYGVYVEYWGLSDRNCNYDVSRRKKLRLYSQHNIIVISLYPRHIGKLDQVFPNLLSGANGQMAERR